MYEMVLSLSLMTAPVELDSHRTGCVGTAQPRAGCAGTVQTVNGCNGFARPGLLRPRVHVVSVYAPPSVNAKLEAFPAPVAVPTAVKVETTVKVAATPQTLPLPMTSDYVYGPPTFTPVRAGLTAAAEATNRVRAFGRNVLRGAVCIGGSCPR